MLPRSRRRLRRVRGCQRLAISWGPALPLGSAACRPGWTCCVLRAAGQPWAASGLPVHACTGQQLAALTWERRGAGGRYAGSGPRRLHVPRHKVGAGDLRAAWRQPWRPGCRLRCPHLRCSTGVSTQPCAGRGQQQTASRTSLPCRPGRTGCAAGAAGCATGAGPVKGTTALGPGCAEGVGSRLPAACWRSTSTLTSKSSSSCRTRTAGLGARAGAAASGCMHGHPC